MLSVCKRFEFCYGHYLPNYNGACANQHGHNSILEVEILEGVYDEGDIYSSMVIDFKELKKIVKEQVIDVLDHQNLNDFIFIPTAENIVRFIVAELKKPFGDYLIRVRVYETSDSYAEWKK